MSDRCQAAGGGGGATTERRPNVVVRPERVCAPSLMSDVAEVLHDVLPVSGGGGPQSSGGAAADRERVVWASFQRCADLARPGLVPQLRPAVGDRPPIVMLLSLAKGFQVWALLASGECVQLLSDRQGPVQHAVLLPNPSATPPTSSSSGNAPPTPAANHDPFCSSRPLLAVVDGAPALAGRPCCTLSFVSLTRAAHVHDVRLPQPVMDIAANHCALVVSMHGALVLFWSHNLHVRCTLSAGAPCDPDCGPPFALSDRWLCYADARLSCEAQSSGGVASAPEPSPSYASHVIAAAKNIGKTVSAIGETVVTSLARPTGHAANTAGGSPPPPALTVLDLTRLQPIDTALDRPQALCDQCPSAAVSHFVCALEGESTVSAVCLAPSDPCVVAAAPASGLCVNVFRLVAHRAGAPFATVHHLYTMVRGSTPAKIRSLSFSADTRWLSACTNHGTAHVFAVTPYGGPVSMRTHGGRSPVNKESRFEQSAGLHDAAASVRHRQASGSSAASEATPPRGSPLCKDSYPSAWQSSWSLGQTSSAGRLPPLPAPVVCYASARVQQQLLSAAALGARAADMVVPAAAGGDGAAQVSPNSSVRRRRTSSLMAQSGHFMEALFARPVAFSLSRPVSAPTSGGGSGHADSLFLLNNQGQLTEYTMGVQPAGQSKFLAETPIELRVEPLAQWFMYRTKHSADVRAPLPTDNLLCASAAVAAKCAGERLAQSMDGLAVGKSHDRKRQGIRSEVKSDAAVTTAHAQKYWVSQVEIGTYSGPHRRLWMGPQFTFHTYATGDGASHSPANVTAAAATRSAVRSEPIMMPGRALPVVIDSSSAVLPDKFQPGVTMEVCGSWSDNDYISCDEQEGRLRQCIADAMRDPSAAAVGDPVVLAPRQTTTVAAPPVLRPSAERAKAAPVKAKAVERRDGGDTEERHDEPPPIGSSYAKAVVTAVAKGKGKQKAAKGKARIKQSSSACDSDGGASDASPMEDARSKFSDSSDSMHFLAGID